MHLASNEELYAQRMGLTMKVKSGRQTEFDAQRNFEFDFGGRNQAFTIVEDKLTFPLLPLSWTKYVACRVDTVGLGFSMEQPTHSKPFSKPYYSARQKWYRGKLQRFSLECRLVERHFHYRDHHTCLVL